MKAQFWSFDVIFAMVIFSVTLAIVSLVWYNISNQLALSNTGSIESMQLQAQGLAARLLEPGVPANWNSGVSVNNTVTWNNVSVGLTQSGSALSTAKIAALEGMSNYNYQASKGAVGVGYDYYVIIKGNSTGIGIGLNPNSYNAVTEQSATAQATLNGFPVRVQVIVWTNSSFGVG